MDRNTGLLTTFTVQERSKNLGVWLDLDSFDTLDEARDELKVQREEGGAEQKLRIVKTEDIIVEGEELTGSDEAPWGPITTMTFDLATDDGTERLGEVNLSDMPTRINAYFGMGQQSWTDCQGRPPMNLPGLQSAAYVRADIADDMLEQLKRNAQGLRNLLEFDWITDEGHREWIQEAINEVDAVVDKAEDKT